MTNLKISSNFDLHVFENVSITIPELRKINHKKTYKQKMKNKKIEIKNKEKKINLMRKSQENISYQIRKLL